MALEIGRNLDWLDQVAGGFGPHQAGVRRVLVDCATVVAFDLDSARQFGDVLATALVALPGSEPVPRRVDATLQALHRAAEALDPTMHERVAVAVDRLIGPELQIGVPVQLAGSARQLLIGAALWPAVFGEHRNPFATVVDLVRLDVFPCIDDAGLMLVHRQLAIPVSFPAPPSPPVRLIIGHRPLN